MAMKYTPGVEEVSMETPHGIFVYSCLPRDFIPRLKMDVRWRDDFRVSMHPAKAGSWSWSW